MKKSLFLGLLLALSVIFVPSIAFYSGNPDGFSLGGVQAVLYLAGLTAASALAIGLFLSRFNHSGLVYRIMSGLVLGLSIAALVQGSFLLWNFGPLDGRGVEWDNWGNLAILELIGWAVILVSGIFTAVRNPRTAESTTQLMLLICLGFALADIVSLDYESDSGTDNQLAISPFIFHESENKLLIVLDTLQSDIFGEILLNHTNELDFLDGFTFYPNTLGGYPTTRVSVPLILSGKFYRNEIPIAEWLKQEVIGNTVIDFYEQQHYGTSVVLNSVPPGGVRQPTIQMSSFGRIGWRQLAADILPVIDAGLFRCSPTFLKPVIYSEGNWFFVRNFEEAIEPLGEPPGFHGDDSRFVGSLVNEASLASDNQGEVKYFHLRGAHFPLQVNENFKYQPDMPATRESYILQTRGALKNVRIMLNKLKVMKIYDSSDILIVGDHGSMSVSANDIYDRNGQKGIVVSKVLSSSRPLFLHKPALSTGKLGIKDTAMHLGDAPCVLTGAQEFCASNIEDDKGLSANRLRHFYFYKWGHEYWNKSRMPPMREYRVSGDVRDLRSWSLAPGSLETLSCGSKIDFSRKSSAENEKARATSPLQSFDSFGLSGREANGRWSDGQRAEINFLFSLENCEPGKITINARPLLRPEHRVQRAEVFLNGVRIGEMNAQYGETVVSEFTLKIPAGAVIIDGLNSLAFFIDKPFSPKTDARKLGFAFHSILFSSG